jgi:hypothetical protein
MRARIRDFDEENYKDKDGENYDKCVKEWTLQNKDEVPPRELNMMTWPEVELLDDNCKSHVVLVDYSSLLTAFPIEHFS